MPYGGRTVSGEFSQAHLSNPKWVASHRGSTTEYMARYRSFAKTAVEKKRDGVREVASALFDFISNERTLWAALQHMATFGGRAPGPDGLSYEQIAEVGDWQWCRSVRDTIRGGWYARDGERLQRIPKGPGRGFRELVIGSIRDRVADRAVVEILQPLLDPLFEDTSFGYRPKKGPLRALATAGRLYDGGARGVWVSVDIRDAFPSVPLDRLLGVLRGYFPDDRLLDFLVAVTRPGERSGLRQGSPLSPLLLNLYLHHMLDRKWRKAYPAIPLLRFADDILLLCRTTKEALEAYDILIQLVHAAGLELKEGVEDAVKSVATGEWVKWMGYGIGGSGGGLKYTVTPAAWDDLREALSLAHGKPNSPLAALRSIAGWVADKGPCYPHTDLAWAFGRIEQLATEQAFEEIFSRDDLKRLWQRSYARWMKLQANMAGD